MSAGPLDIAIVGMGAAFPGPDGLDGFWRTIEGGVDTSREAPGARWAISRELAHAPGAPRPDRVYSTRGCFVESSQLTADELAGVNVDSSLVAELDPSFHLALRAGLRAWRDAGLERNDHSRTRAAVILGNIVLPTEKASALALEVLGRSPGRVHPLNRHPAGLPAAVLAGALDLHGPAFTLDAACASSLYSIAIAARELESGRIDVALAGGLSRPDCLYTQMGFSQLRALSPSGRCSPFDARADGLLVGEGAGVVVLKRLDDALRSGDRIAAVLRGAGLSNDIAGSLMSPDSGGQLRAMRAAYRQAGWRPGDVDLIECHGTGTPVGDAVELVSLESLWREDCEDGAPARPCTLGSVKSNVGHLLTAAGSAGLIKVLLAFRHRVLPPTASFGSPTAALRASRAFRVLSSPLPWSPRDSRTPRRAAVSAFGFGGINAHLLLEEWDESHRPRALQRGSSVPRVNARRDDAVAIVGMDAHFGSASSLEAFCQRVLGAEEAGAGFEQRLGEIEIDWSRFRIPPRELEETLPQQLLMLKVAAGALDDSRLNGREHVDTGVFVGIALDLNTTNFHVRWCAPPGARDSVHPPLNANRTMGALGGIVASRVARWLQAGGPSFTISSEETSGLRALEAAVRALQAGEVSLAVAGAVEIGSDARAERSSNALRPYSRSARARPFAENADGTTLGEGAAALVLKRLADARRDGDRVHAVIRGIGSSAGSRRTGEPPGLETCRAALERAYEDANVDPGLVGWVETHGSGDPGEDSVEAAALARFFGDHPAKIPCAIGSSKAATGHAGAAAGLASIVKAAWCLREELIPGLPVDGPLRKELRGCPRLHAPAAPRHWLHDRETGPRRAGVSGMGIDSSYVHVVLEGLEDATRAGATAEISPAVRSLAPGIFPLRSSGPMELAREVEELQAFARARRDRSADSLAREWLHARQAGATYGFSSAIVARDAITIEQESRRLPIPRLPDRSGRIAFVFPGSGTHFPGMGRELAVAWPGVYRALDRNNGRLGAQMAHGRMWEPGLAEESARDHRSLILSQVSMGTALSDLVRSFGIEPHAAIGYSLGESTSLFAFDVWRERDEMLRRIESSTLFTRELAGPCEAARRAWRLDPSDRVDWAVGVVDRPASHVRAALPRFPRSYLLIVNAPEECVIGGDRRAIEGLVHALGATFVKLTGITTVHCEVAREVAGAYRELHVFDTSPPAGMTFYSAALGRSHVPTRDAAADSIVAQAVDSFDFTRLIETAHADGVRIFIEPGPGNSTSRMIGKILGTRPHAALAACPGARNEVEAFLRFLAGCMGQGLPVDLKRLYPSHEPPSARTSSPTLKVRCGTLLSVPATGLAPEPEPDLVSEQEPELVPAGARAPTSDLAAHLLAVSSRVLEAQNAFLRVRDLGTQTIERVARLQARVGARAAPLRLRSPRAHPPSHPPARRTFLDRPSCLEFAVGSIGRVLGPRFAMIDAHPTRVRLPDGPLMLVDRILAIEGEPLSMTSGRVITEHDVTPDRWYLEGDRIPVSIAVESGQADLFLSGYLGIDLETRGLAVYRLLDAIVTFHRGLPRPGETIRYDIRIERFFRQGATWLFRFRFDSTVNGEPFLTMKDGCAGFFTRAELDAGKGIVHTALDRRPVSGKRPGDWRELAPMAVESFSDSQLNALRSGDLASCFGPRFARLGLKKPVTLPSGKLKLVDRIESLDPSGGRYGLGRIRGEMDIHPDDWFLECHFVDDQVMPGTLMYECCLHTLRVFLLRMGWVGEEGVVAHEPIPGASSQLKCRGQVISSTRMVTYEVSIRELGYGPEPFAIADALMYADGKPIVEILGMSVRLTGLTREGIESMWSPERAACEPRRATRPRREAVFDEKSIRAFAVGKPSEAFGEPYRVFDAGRVIARLPGPPYQFLDRIVEIRGCEPFRLAAGGTIEAEYDVPPDDWCFEANRSLELPFCALLEAALQPCGWFSAFVGSALASPTDLSYRNLGGSAVKLAEVTRESGTLTTRVDLTKVSHSGGMIIQHFDFEMRGQAGPVYRGNTYFGFFSKTALAQQVGIRDASRYAPGDFELRRAERFIYPDAAPFPDRRLSMATSVDAWIPDGGSARLGFIRGSKPVDPSEWFFKAHFFQDPVWPGSLGLESFLQLLKAAAARRWGATSRDSFLTPAAGEKHEWIYRGQVLPTNRAVEVEATITEVDDSRRWLRADGYLSRDGLAIYQMKGFTLRMPDS